MHTVMCQCAVDIAYSNVRYRKFTSSTWCTKQTWIWSKYTCPWKHVHCPSQWINRGRCTVIYNVVIPSHHSMGPSKRGVPHWLLWVLILILNLNACKITLGVFHALDMNMYIAIMVKSIIPSSVMYKFSFWQSLSCTVWCIFYKFSDFLCILFAHLAAWLWPVLSPYNLSWLQWGDRHCPQAPHRLSHVGLLCSINAAHLWTVSTCVNTWDIIMCTSLRGWCVHGEPFRKYGWFPLLWCYETYLHSCFFFAGFRGYLSVWRISKMSTMCVNTAAKP